MYNIKVLLCFMIVPHGAFCTLNDKHSASTTNKNDQTKKLGKESQNHFQLKGEGHNKSRTDKLFPGITRLQDKISLQEYLPISWQHMCSAKFKLVSGSNFTSQNSVFVSCDLKQNDHWSLQTYRKWISANENQVQRALPITQDLLFAFEFSCTNKNASVSLPWPIRGKYLWYVSVLNCTILDYLAEYNTDLDTADTLKVVEFVKSEFKIKSETFFDVLKNYKNVSKQYDCGGEQLEKYVLRNCTEYFTEEEQADIIPKFKQEIELRSDTTTVNTNNTRVNFSSSLGNNENNTLHNLIPLEEKQMLDAIAKFSQEHVKVEHHCSYNNLIYIDQSYSHSTARHHGHFMTDRSQYPGLRFYNMSHSKVSQLSPMFLQWRRYFPRMQYLDLSYNKIKYFSTLTDHGLQNDTRGVLDLRHNNITTFTSEDIEALRVHSNTVFVDIRDNPLYCDCKLTHFVQKLKNASSEIVQIYEYLKNMRCSSPGKFKGMIVSDLEEDFCETLEFVILAAPLAVLGTFVALLIAILLITIKCRKEIMILAFTRFHVNLPCRKLTKYQNKTYDAFIAYSEQDGPWVIKTLLPRLEMPSVDNGPGLKLCIHHRDFPIGGGIAENILEKVKDSHHTVLILSNSFLLSQWCKYEFKTAFSQSLMEKKRHLIMIVKEKLDKQLIDPDLSRCLKTFTFVKLEDRLFWDKLVYALNDNLRKKVKDTGGNVKYIQDVVAEDVKRQEAVPVHMIDVDNENGNIQGDMLKQGDRNNIEYNRHMLENPDFIQDGIWKI